MAIQLSKGQRIDLTKSNPALQNIIIGLGWDLKSFDGGTGFDLDASAFLLNEQGKCRQDLDFIFYNNLSSHSKSSAAEAGISTFPSTNSGTLYDFIRHVL